MFSALIVGWCAGRAVASLVCTEEQKQAQYDLGVRLGRVVVEHFEEVFNGGFDEDEDDSDWGGIPRAD